MINLLFVDILFLINIKVNWFLLFCCVKYFIMVSTPKSIFLCQIVCYYLLARKIIIKRILNMGKRINVRRKINTDKNNVSKENLLGYSSEYYLYKQLLLKSKFVFPEYDTRSRQGISRCVTDLIISGAYSGDQLVEIKRNFNTQNLRLIKHLEKLAEKGFVAYTKLQYKGRLKFNLKRVQDDWLNLDHEKTSAELEKETLDRINNAIEDILAMAHNTKEYNSHRISFC